MRILLLGANGQVGWELKRSLAPLGKLKACAREEADLENLDGLRDVIRQFSPSVIVNAAAYTKVDKAESEQKRANLVNAKAVALLAEETKRLNGWLVHYSTDYVFDGAKEGAYVETDGTNPLSVYGETKLQGEMAISMSGCRHLTFRTSWVYAARGANFAKTVLKLAQEREELKMISDQVGAPTSAELIADVTALALHPILTGSPLGETASGFYHLTATEHTNWRQYAQLVISVALEAGVTLKTNPENVLPIPTSGYPAPARRPLNSRLNTQKLCDTFGLNLPPWQDGVVRVLEETLGAKTSMNKFEQVAR